MEFIQFICIKLANLSNIIWQKQWHRRLKDVGET